MAKRNIRTEATKPLYAGVGVTDLAVELVRDYVTVAQKRVTDLELEPEALRAQAKSRRTAIEKRVADLQSDAKALPAKVQAFVDDNISTVGDAYGDLINRGESLVTRIRKQESTTSTVASARTTSAKAKTTKTQASKATKKASTTARKKSAAPRSSAKATATAAKKTATSATQAVGDAAEKVGD